jgi:predicted anti-sigma-YlaC factor YlaD
MECKQVQETLPDYLGNELDPSVRVAFEGHLSICPQCRREAESLQSAVRCLEQLVGPAAAMSNGSGTSPRERKGRMPFLRRYALRPLTYAATLAVGVGIGWFGKAKPSEVDKVFDPPSAATGQAIVSRIPKGPLSDQVFRNAVALSTALSRPFRSP